MDNLTICSWPKLQWWRALNKIKIMFFLHFGFARMYFFFYFSKELSQSQLLPLYFLNWRKGYQYYCRLI